MYPKSPQTRASQQKPAREETRGFIREVPRTTRRKYTLEEKIHIVLERFRRETTVRELCRTEGVKSGAYCAWTKEFMEAGKERLARRNTVRDATPCRRRAFYHLGRDTRSHPRWHIFPSPHRYVFAPPLSDNPNHERLARP